MKRTDRTEMYALLAEAFAEPVDWICLPGTDWPLYDLAKKAYPADRITGLMAGIHAETLDERRQLVEPDGVDGRNPNGPADDLLHFLHLREEFLVDMEHLLGRVVNPLAFARQLKLLLAAIDEQRLEMPLHRPGLLADSGLRNTVELGRF